MLNKGSTVEMAGRLAASGPGPGKRVGSIKDEGHLSWSRSALAI